MKKKFTDSLRVNDPCTESWDEMFGNDRVRFCSHCAKNVNNLSAMTPKEARKLVRRSGGSLCIRYIQHPETKAPVFADTLTQITRRRVPLMAAGVMTASLSLATLTYAQGGLSLSISRDPAAKTGECEDRLDKSTAEGGTGVVKGRVVDPAGAFVPGITVSLIDANGKQVRRTVTSPEAGEFAFETLPSGTYSIRTTEAMGFAAAVLDNVGVDEGEKTVVIEPAATLTVTVGMTIATGPEFEGALAIAVSNDDVDVAKDLLVRGEDVNHREEDGTTPLFAAVENGHLEMVTLLLEFGAKVNVRNDEKETPLMMIDEDATLELVDLLLRHGAKVNRIAKNGDTALIRAAGEAKPEILNALILSGADLDHQNEEGVTALMNAADENNFANVRILVEAGANVNLRDKDGDNAWDYATEKEVEDFLVAHGVVLDPEDIEESPESEVPESQVPETESQVPGRSP